MNCSKNNCLSGEETRVKIRLQSLFNISKNQIFWQFLRRENQGYCNFCNIKPCKLNQQIRKTLLKSSTNQVYYPTNANQSLSIENITLRYQVQLLNLFILFKQPFCSCDQVIRHQLLLLAQWMENLKYTISTDHLRINIKNPFVFTFTNPLKLSTEKLNIGGAK